MVAAQPLFKGPAPIPKKVIRTDNRSPSLTGRIADTPPRQPVAAFSVTEIPVVDSLGGQVVLLNIVAGYRLTT